MELALLAMLAFAVNKTVSVIKGLANWDTDKNTVVTQVVVWVVGTASIWLAGQASITEHLGVPGLDSTFGALDFASVVLAGWLLGSSGSFAFDIRKAIDNSDTAVESSLLS